MVDNILKTDRIVVEVSMPQVYNDKEKLKTLKHEIAAKYGLPITHVDVEFKPVTIDEDGNKISLAADIINNIQDAGFQKSLMQDYLSLQKITDVDWKDLDVIDNQVNSHINFDQYSKYKNYKFKYVKWSNYLSYGPDNYFDFSQLHGLVLLNSEPANQGGKTTFAIDLLRFALFGKAEKSPTLDSVFNKYLPEATEVVVEAGIEIDGIDYVIRRTISRPALKKRTEKSKCKQTLEYYRKTGDNLELIENCEGESTTQTNNIIKEAVGDVNDFNLVISATQYSLGSLLRMGVTDRGRLYSRWLGLQTLEEKEEIAKKLWKNNYQSKLLSNTYNQAELKDNINDYNIVIEDTNAKITQAEELQATASKNIEGLTQKMEARRKDLKPIADNLDTIDVTTVKNNIEQSERTIQVKQGEIAQLNSEYNKIKNVTYDENDKNTVEAEKKRLQKEKECIVSEQADFRGRFNAVKEQKTKAMKLFEQGICPTCGQKLDGEFHDHHIQELQNSMDAIKKEIEDCKVVERDAANKKALDECEAKLKELAENQRTVTRKAQIENKRDALQINIDKLNLEIAKNKETLTSIEQNKENIAHNNQVNRDITNINQTIANERSIVNAKIGEIAGYKKDIERYNAQIKECQQKIDKLVEEEKTKRNWAVYQELVGKNGIVKLVLKKALPILNNEIARILNGLCDFEVKLEIDDKNNVNINMNRDGVKMDLAIAGSGFEETMASLALRSALASISTMSKPNFLCTDEVLGQTAASNLENVHEIFKRIVANYDFILNITHNEDIADWHDGGRITVTKVNNVSKIK